MSFEDLIYKLDNTEKLTSKSKLSTEPHSNAVEGVQVLNKDEKKLQIYSAKKVVMTIDKISKFFMRGDFDETVEGILECRKPQVVTPMKIEIPAELKGMFKITAFDAAVFDACVSEQAADNEYTTLSILHHTMCGNNSELTDERKAAIMQSLKKLSMIHIEFDTSDANKRFGYNGGNPFKYSGYILPIESLSEMTVNGQYKESVIHFLRKTPLFEIAQMRGQFTSTAKTLLDVPRLNSTELVVSIKDYLLTRITEIKGSHSKHKAHLTGKTSDGKPIYKCAKKLNKVITFESIFERCELSNATKRQQQQARETIKKILEHFKTEGLIKSFEFVKKDRKFYSIHFEV